MNNLEFVGVLKYYERRSNSYYGNPKYFGVFEDENGGVLGATTATNSACAYVFTNSPEKTRKVNYHITKSGNKIIDRITILE